MHVRNVCTMAMRDGESRMRLVKQAIREGPVEHAGQEVDKAATQVSKQVGNPANLLQVLHLCIQQNC